ncbi:hypothetical protein ACFRAR_18655 [Kitasatospora sp. NPDC056651]|uniref:hypothetical protein n=1 Tax=Kitasatospora sp. NPDC056651 TaxID=3345892 RepID=UPI0036B0B392
MRTRPSLRAAPPGEDALLLGRERRVTGVVTKGEAPWFPGVEPAGQKVSISLEDNGRGGDRMGWVWGVFGQPVSDCQGTVPFIRTTGGDFSVRG